MRFTENEEKVLYALIRWPHLKDSDLAEKLGMGRSTITAIRNRFESKRLYQTLKVPDLEKIGCEIISAVYGEFSSAGAAGHLSQLENDISSIFFMLSMGTSKLSLGAAATFTDIKRHIEDYHDLHTRSGASYDRKHNYALFPLKLSRIHRFFDYAPLLKERFKLKDIKEEATQSKRNIELTGNDRQVLSAMVKHPEYPDGKIASVVGMSRQTVGSITKKLEGQGLIKKIRVPDVGKLGYELVGFTHLHLNPEKPREAREKAIEAILSDSPHILKVSGGLEGVMLSVFKDYTEYLEKHESILSSYKRSGMLLDDPVVKLFSTRKADMEMQHRYHPLVEEVFSSTP